MVSHCKKYPLHSDVITNGMCVLKIFLDRLSRNDCLGPGSVISIKAGGEECIRYCNHSHMLILKQRYRNFSGLYEGSCIRFQIVNISWDAYDPIFRNVMLLGKMQNQDTQSYCYCSLNLLCEFSRPYRRRLVVIPYFRSYVKNWHLKGWILLGFDFRCHDGKGKTCTKMWKTRACHTLAHYNLCTEAAKEADLPHVKCFQAISILGFQK